MLKINQNGVKPGPRKLAQFLQAFKLTETPKLYGNDNVEDPIVRVKLFDPCGSATWFLTEFSELSEDGIPNLAFGYVTGMGSDELGYIPIDELANLPGRFGIGIEIDVHFTPKPLSEIRKERD